MMKPFILKQHDKDFAKVRELRESELAHITGGFEVDEKLKTVTVTPNGDGGDDGKDAN
jgi:bacteriocin-like protein